MKNSIVYICLLVSAFVGGCVTAETHRSRKPAQDKKQESFRIVEYKAGALKILMSTCGGRIQPTVTFKALKENLDFKSGIYSATLGRSIELPPDTPCPYVVDPVIEIDLKKYLKAWSDSEAGTATSRLIFEADGFIDILVSPFQADIEYQDSAQ